MLSNEKLIKIMKFFFLLCGMALVATVYSAPTKKEVTLARRLLLARGIFQASWKKSATVLLCIAILSVILLYITSSLSTITYSIKFDRLQPSPLEYNQHGVCRKGPSYDSDWMRSEFGEFIKVYEKRPKVENTYGTKLVHQFGLWLGVRRSKPKFIIESGIYLGLGTWMLRQAAPKARLILLDPKPIRRLSYVDRHQDTTYLVGNDFQDFNVVDWEAINVDPGQSLVFFDDHQSGVVRTLQAWRKGFHTIMFDDNYGWTRGGKCKGGDNFSIKKACDLQLGRYKPNDDNTVFCSNFAKTVRPFTLEDIKDYNETFNLAINTYQEVVVPCKGKDKYRGEILFPNFTINALYNKFNATRIPKNALAYNNICIIQLNKKPQ